MSSKTKTYLNLVLILLALFIMSLLIEPFSNLVDLLMSIIMPFAIAFGMAFVCRPIALFISKKTKLKMLFANLIIALVILVVLVLFLTTTLPSLSVQIFQIATGLLASLEDLVKTLNDSAIGEYIETIDYQGLITLMQTKVTNTLSSLSSNITNFVLVPTLFVYFLFCYESIRNNIKKTFLKYHLYSQYEFLKRLEKDLNSYVRGLAVTISILAIICAVSFSILGLQNSVFLGVLVGVSGIIPIFGALISGAVAVILAYGVSFEFALITLIIIIVAQILESNIITPNLQGKYLNVHPIIILLSITVFTAFFGFFGMLLTIPLLLAVRIGFDIYMKNKIIEIRSNNEDIQKLKEEYHINEE